jgi:hypothetical protein
VSTIAARRRVLAAALSLLAALPLSSFAAKPPKEWDGLERVKSKRVQYLYVRPGASLAGYKRVKLDAAAVSFDKNWDPSRDTRELSRRLSKSDMDAIRADLSAEFGRIFAEELGRGGYALTNDDAEDVLRVVPAIADLYIAAPGALIAGRGQTIVAETGNMTLVAELRDAVTGQVLARVVDKQEVAAAGGFEVASRVSNSAAAGQVIARWAGVLRKGLDEARGKPQGK